MHKNQWGSFMVVIALLCLFVLQYEALPIFSSSFTADAGSLPIPADVGGSPSGYDPLTTQEMGAIAAVAQAAAPSRAATASVPEGEQEVLLVERREAAKAAYAKGTWPRQGDVYVYEYATDTLIHTVVDVQSGAVVTVERLQGVQLPLTAREEQHALALIEADGSLWPRLSARYQAITGESLQHLTQLQVKVSLFHADVMPDRVNVAAARCGQHRCAQILLFTVDKTLLEIMPIVDLSQRQVVQVLDAE